MGDVTNNEEGERVGEGEGEGRGQEERERKTCFRLVEILYIADSGWAKGGDSRYAEGGGGRGGGICVSAMTHTVQIGTCVCMYVYT